MAAAVQTLPAFASTVLPAAAGTYVTPNATTRTVVVERSAVAVPKEIGVPRTVFEHKNVSVPRTFVSYHAHNYNVQHKVNVPELRVGYKTESVSVPKVVYDDAQQPITVPRVGLRDQEILVPKVIMVKKTIQVPYHFTEQKSIPIKVPRVEAEQVPVQVAVPYQVNREHTVNEVRTTIVPRTQTYVEQHTQVRPHTVVEKRTVFEHHVVERPHVYEQEAPRVIQQVIPGQTRSYYGATRVAGYGFNYGGYNTAFATPLVAPPTAFGTAIGGFRYF